MTTIAIIQNINSKSIFISPFLLCLYFIMEYFKSQEKFFQKLDVIRLNVLGGEGGELPPLVIICEWSFRWESDKWLPRG